VRKGLVVADDIHGFHAEMKLMYTAGKRWLLPTRGVATNALCKDGKDSCYNQIKAMAEKGGFDLKLSSDGREFEFIKRL
jgi:hypothetical protein